MKEEDLEKTLPIKIDVEEKPQDSRVTRHEIEEDLPLREEKYSNIEMENKIKEEERAEEVLAEKNIALTEELLKQEKEEKKEKNNTKKKESLIDKIKKLSKKQKIILLGILIAIIIILIVVFIILLAKPNKEKETTPPPVEEKTPVIVDNFYYKDGTLHLLNSSLKEIGTYTCNNKNEKLCYVAFNNYRDQFDADMVLNEDGTERQQRLPIINNDYVFIYDNAKEEDNDIVLYSLQSANIINVYSDVKAYDDNYIAISDNKGKYGLLKIDETVEELIPPTYDYLGKLDREEYLVAKDSRSYFMINLQNKKISKDINGMIKSYSKDLIVSLVDNSYNVYNYDGNLLASSYDFASVTNSYMTLVKNEKVFIQDKEKNKYNEEGIALKNKEYVRKYIFDSDGKLKETKWSYSLKDNSDTELELIIYGKNITEEEHHLINKTNIEVNKKYNYINYFDKKLYFYKDQEKNELLGSYTCTNENTIVNGDLILHNCTIAKDTNYEDNEMTAPTKETTIPILNNRFVFIADGENNIVLYDLVTKEKKASYVSVNTYTNNKEDTITHQTKTITIIALNHKDRYGMFTISDTGISSVHSFDYEKMEKLGDYVLVKEPEAEGGKWKVLFDKESVSTSFPNKVVYVTKDKKYFKLKEKENYFVYDEKGNKVTEDTFIYVNLLGTYFLGVNTKKEVNLYNYDGTKITKEGKTITSTTCTTNELAKASYKNGIYTISICNGDNYVDYEYNASTNTYAGEEEKTENKEENVSNPSSSEEKKD